MACVQPMISPKWLNDVMAARESSSSSSKLCVLDATWLGIMNEGRDSYRAAHIPGSLHFDLNECRDKTSRLHFTLPTTEAFAKYVGDLGIDNDTHVIVYENDPIFRMMSAPRTWWMFRLFGHNKISVLDGGLKQWQADGYTVKSGDQPVVEKKNFTANSENPTLIKRFDDVLDNQKTAKFILIDSRRPEWFDGSMESIWPGLPLGHILKTTNVPFTSFIRDDSDQMIGREEILHLFKSHGIDLEQPVTSSCFVGISACTVALAAYVVGKEDVAVYDGSWDEFSKKAPSEAFVIVPNP